MDIEKLIERLRTESLYKDKATLEIMDLCMDAATALSALQAENEKLRDELEQVKRERDAAVNDLKKYGQCGACKNFQEYRKDGCGADEYSYCDGGFEWRGPEEG